MYKIYIILFYINQLPPGFTQNLKRHSLNIKKLIIQFF